jgi:hypothetical protein
LLHIDLIVGDVFDVTSLLSSGHYQTGGSLRSSSNSHLEPFTIHKDVINQFHSIDTSNLVDSIGLLPLLVVTVPLLDHTNPNAALYTNTLLYRAVTILNDNDLRQWLHYDLGGLDLEMINEMLGIRLSQTNTLTRDADPFTEIGLTPPSVTVAATRGVRASAHLVWHPLLEKPSPIMLSQSPYLLRALASLTIECIPTRSKPVTAPLKHRTPGTDHMFVCGGCYYFALLFLIFRFI